MKTAVLCDFDGTITMKDTAEIILDKFARGNWKDYERQFENGELTLEECLKKEFSLVRASEQEIIDSLGDIEFRRGFDELLDYCTRNHIPLVIVSAGLDFVIKHFVQLKGWKDSVKICMAKTTVTSRGIKFRFPRRYDRTSGNFKQDFVRKCKSEDRRTVFIGDGTGDSDAAKEVDYAFAIKNSRLAEFCAENEVPCRYVTDFCQVVEALDRIPPTNWNVTHSC